ncbi:hypothetical protein LRD69_15225 [Streptomyces sp. JH14]|uniref:hypothetical protein n=1 Tax=Streptomyces sp. JH14 TaxID=2793630 RepID=UPI0023F98D81|nr:hypothetical protein [Streptomyces sp. JH14]MDF6043460.1 hypothetical protein [Streptomyces sp. JH14]
MRTVFEPLLMVSRFAFDVPFIPLPAGVPPPGPAGAEVPVAEVPGDEVFGAVLDAASAELDGSQAARNIALLVVIRVVAAMAARRLRAGMTLHPPGLSCVRGEECQSSAAESMRKPSRRHNSAHPR